MKYLLTFIILLTLVTSSYAQREVSIEDMDADGDATIEIIAPQSGGLELRSMLLGVNQSSGGFLRMLSDDPLSLRTNNINRLTITNGGDVGIGTTSPMTKLFVQDGRIGAETMDVGSNAISQASGYDFYTSSTYQGGMSYVNEGADGKLLFVNNQGGDIALKTGPRAGLLINSSGQVQINDLEGAGNRPAYTDVGGNLSAEESISEVVIIGSSQFKEKYGYDQIYYWDEFLDFDEPIFDKPNEAVAHPQISASKFIIEEVVFYYFDDNLDVGQTLKFEYTAFDQNERASKQEMISSPDASFGIRFRTLTINQTIDQSIGERFILKVDFPDNDVEDLRFYHAVVKYTRLH